MGPNGWVGGAELFRRSQKTPGKMWQRGAEALRLSFAIADCDLIGISSGRCQMGNYGAGERKIEKFMVYVLICRHVLYIYIRICR